MKVATPVMVDGATHTRIHTLTHTHKQPSQAPDAKEAEVNTVGAALDVVGDMLVETTSTVRTTPDRMSEFGTYKEI